jgi:hypothetical protein
MLSTSLKIRNQLAIASYYDFSYSSSSVDPDQSVVSLSNCLAQLRNTMMPLHEARHHCEAMTHHRHSLECDERRAQLPHEKSMLQVTLIISIIGITSSCTSGSTVILPITR